MTSVVPRPHSTGFTVPVKVHKTYDFATEILDGVVGHSVSGQLLPAVPEPAHIPGNIAPEVMPGNRQMMERHQTRFLLDKLC